jgi:uncharacterized protein (UPF0548 family)
LSIGSSLATVDPGTFAHDRSRSSLGFGEDVFASAKRAFVNWRMFDLGWVRVVNTTAQIQCQQIIAVEVRALGLWSVNLSKILETGIRRRNSGFSIRRRISTSSRARRHSFCDVIQRRLK